MFTTSLRKVGGSVMLAVPPAILDLLNLRVEARVGLAAENGRLVIETNPRRRYTLAELLAETDYAEQPSPEDRTSADSPAVGHELL